MPGWRSRCPPPGWWPLRRPPLSSSSSSPQAASVSAATSSIRSMSQRCFLMSLLPFVGLGSVRRRRRGARLELQAARRGGALRRGQDDLGDDGQQGHDDGRREPPVVAVGVDVDDRVAERDDPRQRGDRGRGHHVDRRDPHAAEDQRQRQRELDPAHDLRAGHAHAARGVDRVAVDLAHAGVGVGEDGGDGEQHERQGEVGEAHADVGDEEGDQGQARAPRVPRWRR